MRADTGRTHPQEQIRSPEYCELIPGERTHKNKSVALNNASRHRATAPTRTHQNKAVGPHIMCMTEKIEECKTDAPRTQEHQPLSQATFCRLLKSRLRGQQLGRGASGTTVCSQSRREAGTAAAAKVGGTAGGAGRTSRARATPFAHNHGAGPPPPGASIAPHLRLQRLLQNASPVPLTITPGRGHSCGDSGGRSGCRRGRCKRRRRHTCGCSGCRRMPRTPPHKQASPAPSGRVACSGLGLQAPIADEQFGCWIVTGVLWSPAATGNQWPLVGTCPLVATDSLWLRDSRGHQWTHMRRSSVTCVSAAGARSCSGACQCARVLLD